MAFFDEADSFQAWVDQIEPLGPCAPGLVWGRARGDVTCVSAFAEMESDDGFRAGWAEWCLLHDGTNLSTALRQMLIDATGKVPRWAFDTWRRVPNLSLIEQRRLRRFFYSRDRRDGAVLFHEIERAIRDRRVVPATEDSDIDRGSRRA